MSDQTRAVSCPPLSPPGLRIHIVGIGGAGMSAIATVLAEMGHVISGSDAAPSATLDRLVAHGLDARVGHAAANLPRDTDLVSISTAIDATNPEVVAANRSGIPVLRRGELLAAICATRSTIAVSGTHGKTTTSSLVAEVLTHAGVDPGFLIGAQVASLGTSARWGAGDLFVVEADESDGSAFQLPRRAAVVTNVEPDHLDHHGGFEVLRERFEGFVDGTDGTVLLCADDPVAAEIAATRGGRALVRTYGFAAGADYRIEDLVTDRDGARWVLWHHTERLGVVRLALPGAHNATNATAAIAIAVESGIDPATAIAGIADHRGVARRFERRGEARGVTFIDDYAHLPSEVAAALAAARGGGWRRVVCTFQPHRFSRTAALWPTFADAFADADLLVVTGIYTAGEQPRPGITGDLVLRAVLDAHPHRSAAYMPTLDDVEDYLAARLRPGDLCITLGAGDLTTIPTRLLDRWDR